MRDACGKVAPTLAKHIGPAFAVLLKALGNGSRKSAGVWTISALEKVLDDSKGLKEHEKSKKSAIFFFAITVRTATIKHGTG